MGTAEEKKQVIMRLSENAHTKLLKHAEKNRRNPGAEAAFRIEEQLKREKVPA